MLTRFARFTAGTALAALLLSPLCAPAQARPLDEVTASGTLKVALYSDNKPWSDMDNGKPVGIDVDLAEAIAKALKVKAEIKLYDASEDVGGDFRLRIRSQI